MEKMLTKWCLDASGIAVRVFVEGSGQSVQISLDEEDHYLVPLPDQQPVWASDLDPSVPHIISIIKQNPRGQYLAFDNILVTYNDAPAEAATAPTIVNTTNTETAEPAPAPTIDNPNTKTETPTKQPEGQSGLTTTTKVGIAVGLVGAVCLSLLGALARRYTESIQ